jgi:carboxyl-terminal processing protease
MRYSLRMRRAALLATGAVVGGAFLLGYGLSRGDRATAPVRLPPVVDQVREALAARYYRPVPPQVLRLASVEEMLSALGDPYTSYLGQDDYALLQRQISGSYSGIGVSAVAGRSGLLVVSTRPGPAEAAGLRAGDTIVRIGRVSAAGLGPAEVFARVSGPAGTPVRLEILREGRVHWLSVPRANLRPLDVTGRMLVYAGRRWGALRVRAFAAGTARMLRYALQQLQREGAAGFVLDLRDDPGGVLGAAVATASLFLDGGPVVTLRGLHTPEKTFRAHAGAATRLPLAVLVDRGTASSAEVVAAALRDRHRAEIVGQRTYGKALVQLVDPLGDGGALELTVAHYYTPGGTDISDVGLRPDVLAADRPGTRADEGLAAALRTLARPTS